MEKTIEQINENAVCWYTVYTSAGAEKRVEKQLEQAGLESYLPLQSVVRVWNGRRRKVMVPVVPGIIFVCLPEGEMAKVTSMKGAALLLKGEGRYVSISIEQLESFRRMVENTDEFIEFVSEQQEGALNIEGLGTVLVKVTK